MSKSDKIANYRIAKTSKGEICVFKNITENIVNFSKVPNKIIQEVADLKNLYLYNEVCQHTGKVLYKVGQVINENGGVVNLYSTISVASRNRFVLER